jgi:hypothetical protein
MVNDTQNYWGFGLFLSSGILGNRGHDVSEKTETDPVSETSCPLLPKIPDDRKSPKPK